MSVIQDQEPGFLFVKKVAASESVSPVAFPTGGIIDT
jgi:hypothetical protein